jgi:ketosteroid isomerase-like protein
MSAYRELLDRYVERYNAGDLDSVMDLYAEDAVQGMPDGIFEGRSAIHERLPNGIVLPPTGKRVEVRGMEVVRVGPDRKIVVNILYYDNLSVAVQLGRVPEGAIA